MIFSLDHGKHAQRAGIAHLSRKVGGQPVCNSRQAHIILTMDRFDATGFIQCRRCLQQFNKWQAMKQRAVRS